MKTNFLFLPVILFFMFGFTSSISSNSFEETINTTNEVKQTIVSSITFKIKNAGIGIDGSFKGFQGTVDFNPADLERSKFDVSVDAKTIDTDNNMRDNHLREDEYFGVEKHPKISMKSTSVTKVSDSKYKATFDLTLKGKTKSVSFPFSYNKTSTGYKLNGSFEIDRRDFGVGGSSWILSDDVKVFIDLEVKN
ncbi:MAG: YceI family protein [Flexibacter sp. CG_4_10_14_3_um_filter_32_15]|nr:MAG: YceI family protein [Flexibacter sp. CG_4_10_14_3_um_filter_32_15]